MRLGVHTHNSNNTAGGAENSSRGGPGKTRKLLVPTEDAAAPLEVVVTRSIDKKGVLRFGVSCEYWIKNKCERAIQVTPRVNT